MVFKEMLRMEKPVDVSLSFLKEMLGPIKALIDPRKYYEQLSKILDKYGVYGAAITYFAGWIGASFIVFFIILFVEITREIVSLDLAGFVTAPLRAVIYSFGFPAVAALVDSIVITLLLLPFPRKRPIYDVFPIRASSLLTYGFRVVYLEIIGKLSLKGLLAATGSPLGFLFLLLGASLTMYGIRKTIGAPLLGAIVGGLGPLTYKLLLIYI